EPALRSLRAEITRLGRLPPERALRIFLQWCFSMEVEQASGPTDVLFDPEHVLLDAAGEARVLHFTIERLWIAAPSGERETPSLMAVRRAGNVLREMIARRPPRIDVPPLPARLADPGFPSLR